MSALKDQVLEQLKRVKGPDLSGNVVDLGLVSEVVIANGKVFLSITVPSHLANELEPLREAAAKVVSDIDGIEKAIVSLTAEKSPGQGSAPPPPPKMTKTADVGPAPATDRRPPSSRKPGLPGVKHIIAVASGKGGVGKSTTTANLALGLKSLGLDIGVLDADIYGPSIPRIFGISGRPEPVQGKILKPMEGYGLKVMSMGFLVEEETPMIWRGPMVISALTQMLREVEWGDLDLLVVDMPPGTGDAQLTMAQQVPLAGAVIVSTPQDLALIDARKGLKMFEKVNVPVLGIVENMSHFICPSCGQRSDIFGHGGARDEAEKLGAPFLGEVPLHMTIRETSDAGTPVVISEPDSDYAFIYKDIAAKVFAVLQTNAAGEGSVRPAPKITIEA
ncbi:MAG: iron-sulfur cluster carrier protein ApbC [Pseudomonadota bacterium]